MINIRKKPFLCFILLLLLLPASGCKDKNGTALFVDDQADLLNSEQRERIVRINKKLLEEYEQMKPERKPLTFDQVEEIWDEQIRPLIKDMSAMRDVSSGQEPPPENSRWYTNWQVRYKG